jgi:hypothetical protein
MPLLIWKEPNLDQRQLDILEIFNNQEKEE